MRWMAACALLTSLAPIDIVEAQTASTAVEPDSAPIVVTGERVSPPEARRLASDFVSRTGVASGHLPAARWEEAICPRAVGLGSQHAALVEQIVRDTAQSAGARVARTGCVPNIVISFSADAAATVRAVQDQAPQRLREVRGDARTALLTGRAPIRWWYVTESRGSDGNSGQLPGMSGALENGEGGSALPSNGESGSQRLYNSSMISTRSVRVIRNASVVVDVGRSEGVSLQAVAAYAAFVALAEIQPRQPAPEASILALFEGAETGRELSALDQAFLRGLYRMPLDRGGRLHRSYLLSEVTDAALGLERPARRRDGH